MNKPKCKGLGLGKDKLKHERARTWWKTIAEIKKLKTSLCGQTWLEYEVTEQILIQYWFCLTELKQININSDLILLFTGAML